MIVTATIRRTKSIAEKVANKIKKGGIILLEGDLGSGKTTFTKYIAAKLCIEKFAVKSPTYTYIRHYKLASAGFYHIDLYRLNNADDLLAQEIQEICQNEKNIIIIEWADKIDFQLPVEKFKINFQYLTEDKRKITITESKSFDAGEIYKKYKTPSHVIRHCKKVASFACKIGKAFQAKGYQLNLKTIKQAGEVHDALRVCDFRDFEEKNFHHITKQYLKVWRQLREKYGKIGHAKAMGDILMQMGETKVAHLVYKHDFHCIDKLYSLEEKILYYADKRVNLAKIVSLKERLKAGKERNLSNKSKFRERSDIVKKIYQLEAKLSKLLGKDLAKMR